jgi:hypothetical protein
MPFHFLARLLDTLSPRPVRRHARVRSQTRPPMARALRTWPSWHERLMNWLADYGAGSQDADELEYPAPCPEKEAALAEARLAFRAALHDVKSDAAGVCCDHIRAARSLHDLWHLRSQVFSLVSRQHSQDEADRRLAQVDHHFPDRSERSGKRAGAAQTMPAKPPSRSSAIR